MSGKRESLQHFRERDGVPQSAGVNEGRGGDRGEEGIPAECYSGQAV